MTQEFQNIKFKIDERVARITFARPPLNVFNIAMMGEIGEALNECVSRREVVAIVFDAAKDAQAFSAGVAFEEHVPETIFQLLDWFIRSFARWRKFQNPQSPWL